VVRETTSRTASPGVRWQVIATVSTPEVTAALEGLKARGINVDFRLVGLAAEAATQAVSAVCRGEAVKAVVLTSQPELVACLANRNEQLRAAAVTDTATGERVQRTLNPNLLAIDPSARGVHELKALLKAFILS
jgi:ribose 5-phosphate isomerase RpiB